MTWWPQLKWHNLWQRVLAQQTLRLTVTQTSQCSHAPRKTHKHTMPPPTHTHTDREVTMRVTNTSFRYHTQPVYSHTLNRTIWTVGRSTNTHNSRAGTLLFYWGLAALPSPPTGNSISRKITVFFTHTTRTHIHNFPAAFNLPVFSHKYSHLV